MKVFCRSIRRFQGLLQRSTHCFSSRRTLSTVLTLPTLRPSPLLNPKTQFLHEFLSLISTKEELEEYQKVYGLPGLQRLAVIKIGGEVIEKQLTMLTESLRFLQDAGLFPIVVHGVGPQINEALQQWKTEPEYVEGMRVTDEKTLQLVRTLFLQANSKLLNALRAAQIPARPFTSGVFTAAFRDRARIGYVGDVTDVTCDNIYSAIHAAEIPVLSTLGETESGQTLNINADVAARMLSMKIRPYKTIFISSKGGWIEDDGTKRKKIVMSEEYKEMAARDYTGRQGTLLKLKEMKALLEVLPRTSSVVLTSAAGLKREILGEKASTGTVCVYGKKEKEKNNRKQTQQAYVHSSSRKYKVAVLGGRGYVGRELIRLIGRHPSLELIAASSHGSHKHTVLDATLSPPLHPHTGVPMTPTDYSLQLSIDPHMKFQNFNPTNLLEWSQRKDVDLWILALPNGIGQSYVNAIQQIQKDKRNAQDVILDVSADQRFNLDWVYGQPETAGAKQRIRHAKRISNPGCYATAAQLGLLPLLSTKKESNRSTLLLDTKSPPRIFGVSGFSGAGTSPLLVNHSETLRDNLIAYKSLNHLHEKEIAYQLKMPVTFHPHVGPFFQGIHVTLSLQLNSPKHTLEEIQNSYHEFYQDERLVQVTTEMPWVQKIAREDHVTIGGFQMDPSDGRLVVISTIDNLRKGAATQAIQNINLALDIDEYAGIIERPYSGNESIAAATA